MAAWSLDIAPVLAELAPSDAPTFLVEGALRDAADEVLAHIVGGWPVATGKSIAGFRVSGSIISNDVDYAEYVNEGMVDKLAEEGLEKARGSFKAKLDDLMARRALAPGQRAQNSRTKVAEILSRQKAAPTEALSLFELGDVAAALQVFRASVATERLVMTAQQLGLSAEVIALLRAGEAKKAITLVAQSGRTVEAQQLARLAA